jgi:hypothetical protein
LTAQVHTGSQRSYITKIKFSWNLRNGKVALLLIGEWRDKLDQIMDEYLCIHWIEMNKTYMILNKIEKDHSQ